MTGTEHEYSINGPGFRPLPVNDEVIRELRGEYSTEAKLGDVVVSKELQKHVLEVMPSRPSVSLRTLEAVTLRGVRALAGRLGDGRRLMGLGMHPTLKVTETAVWDGEEGEIYREYDRLFDIRQHGWLNIQAVQVNTPYPDSRQMVRRFNKLRSLIPYAVAVSAASPFVEGGLTGKMDNRLVHYMANQSSMPLICNGVIPERLGSAREYRDIQAAIFRDLRARGASMLCREWVNSRGVIVRYSRKCLELKALDEQDCVRSDMAVTAFVTALCSAPKPGLETDGDALRDILDAAISGGTAGLHDDLDRLYRVALRHADREQRHYLPLVRRRIDEGSLAEVLVARHRENGGLEGVMEEVSASLLSNEPVVMPDS